MTDTAAHTSEQAAGYIADVGFLGFVKNYVYGGIVYSLGLEANEGIRSAGDLILGPIRALGRGVIGLVDGTFAQMLRVTDAGTAATVQSFTDGAAAALGPLAQPFSVGVAMLSLFVFITAVNRIGFSPWSFVRSMRG